MWTIDPIKDGYKSKFDGSSELLLTYERINARFTANLAKKDWIGYGISDVTSYLFVTNFRIVIETPPLSRSANIFRSVATSAVGSLIGAGHGVTAAIKMHQKFNPNEDDIASIGLAHVKGIEIKKGNISYGIAILHMQDDQKVYIAFPGDLYLVEAERFFNAVTNAVNEITSFLDEGEKMKDERSDEEDEKKKQRLVMLANIYLGR